jgi:Ala-tRNA(Pro) deacylase
MGEHMGVYAQLKILLQNNHATFREIIHVAQGTSEEIAKIRGTSLHQGAKAMVTMIKMNDQTYKYCLAVCPADKQISFEKIRAYFHGIKAMLASPDDVKKLTQCVIGSMPPFSFNENLTLLVDPSLLDDNQEIAFNAGCLDHSIVLKTEDYKKIANANVFNIIKYRRDRSRPVRI